MTASYSARSSKLGGQGFFLRMKRYAMTTMAIIASHSNHDRDSSGGADFIGGALGVTGVVEATTGGAAAGGAAAAGSALGRSVRLGRSGIRLGRSGFRLGRSGRCLGLGHLRVYLRLGHDGWRLARDDHRGQLIAGVQLAHPDYLSILEDLDAAFVQFRLGEATLRRRLPRTSTDVAVALTTTASLTSVTVTGVIVVVVVTVAVPFIPGFSSFTAICLPSTFIRKSFGTVISCVPRWSR